ncbi:hypothetical protein FHR99_002570 [Litorivivens lipolytica]|uniref:RING-type E3 ubiquitin transferase n=1 Tax=Litorivivens lipolytica TaxID=1524264 RepID=A0A7W4W6C1_9GAMM|nr:GIDE domain-containing protein [Litorivivens lipolytica]MBB3048296.1 hypothetical protein [Litorivivens lipolytica]
MDTFSDYLWVELFTLGFGLFAWIGSFSALKKARLIEDTPTSKIRSAPQGYVEIIGLCEVHPENGPLHAKLTGNPCVWYRYKIERYESSGKNSRWRTLESQSSKTPIVLNDQTGRCFVHPDGADVSPRHTRTWHGNSRYPSSPKNTSSLFGRRYRYTESVIEPGQMLYALGHFETLHPPSMESQARSNTNALITAWKRDYDQLIERFDTNTDGEIDLQEWEAVREAAHRQALQDASDNYDNTPVNVMSYSPVKRQPFLISTREPKALSRRYRWQFIGLGVAAIGCTLTFLFLLPGAWQAWQWL